MSVETKQIVLPRYQSMENDSVMQIRLPKRLKEDFTAACGRKKISSYYSWQSFESPSYHIREMMEQFIKDNPPAGV